MSDYNSYSLVKQSIPQNQISPHYINTLLYPIIRVSLHRIHFPIFTLLHNPHMIRHAISIPIKKDNRPRRRTTAILLPFPIAPEPLHACRTGRKFRNCPSLDQSALIRAP